MPTLAIIHSQDSRLLFRGFIPRYKQQNSEIPNPPLEARHSNDCRVPNNFTYVSYAFSASHHLIVPPRCIGNRLSLLFRLGFNSVLIPPPLLHRIYKNQGPEKRGTLFGVFTFVSDLNYEELAKVAFETYCKSLDKKGRTWRELPTERRVAWIASVQEVIGLVTAADLT